MSLPTFDVQGSLFESLGSIAADLFDHKDKYKLFATKIWPLLASRRAELAECYEPENGRPGIEPVVLLGVLIFQFLERAPDRQAAELVKYHLGWKLALNLKLGADGFHPTTLVHFRQRLLTAGKSELALRAVLEALEKEGFIAKRSKQRLDSTHILGAVARLSALECVRETLALALEELDGNLPGTNVRHFGNSSGNAMSKASLITKVPRRLCNPNAGKPARIVCASWIGSSHWGPNFATRKGLRCCGKSLASNMR